MVSTPPNIATPCYLTASKLWSRYVSISAATKDGLGAGTGDLGAPPLKLDL